MNDTKYKELLHCTDRCYIVLNCNIVSTYYTVAIIIPGFDMKSGNFLTFMTILPRPQIHFGDSLGRAQNHGWEKPNFLREKEN